MQPAIDIINTMLHAVGRTVNTLDSRIKPWAVFNQAGQALFTRHAWSWRGENADLLGVADQDFIALPEDFAKCTSVSLPDTVYGVKTVSQAAIRRFREAPVTGATGVWFVSFEPWNRQANPELLPTPRMDIYPTPTVAGTPTLKLEYQRQWRRIRASDPRGVPNLPDYTEWALTLKGRAMFKALHDDYAGSGADEALYEKEIARLIQEDTPQMNYGRMRGGADEAPTGGRYVEPFDVNL